jgi:hypothetical protein
MYTKTLRLGQPVEQAAEPATNRWKSLIFAAPARRAAPGYAEPMALTDDERAELQSYRSQDLLQRMRAISEEQWASGWQRGLEHDLYLMAFEGTANEYGVGAVAPDALAQLRRLAQLSGVWWAWSEDGRKPVPIPLDEAARRFSKLVARDENDVEQALSVQEVKRLYEQAAAADWNRELLTRVLGLADWHIYRLRANPRLTLVQREEERVWELRFGSTTVALVTPRWAAS